MPGNGLELLVTGIGFAVFRRGKNFRCARLAMVFHIFAALPGLRFSAFMVNRWNPSLKLCCSMPNRKCLVSMLLLWMRIVIYVKRVQKLKDQRITQHQCEPTLTGWLNIKRTIMIKITQRSLNRIYKLVTQHSWNRIYLFEATGRENCSTG